AVRLFDRVHLGGRDASHQSRTFQLPLPAGIANVAEYLRLQFPNVLYLEQGTRDRSEQRSERNRGGRFYRSDEPAWGLHAVANQPHSRRPDLWLVRPAGWSRQEPGRKQPWRSRPSHRRLADELDRQPFDGGSANDRRAKHRDLPPRRSRPGSSVRFQWCPRRPVGKWQYRTLFW